MNKRALLGLFLAIVLTMGLFAGCGTKTATGDTASTLENQTGATASEQTATTPKKKNVTLSIAASQDWIKDWDRELADKFTEQTGIKIDFQLNPNDQYANIVKAKLASGEGVDTFMCNGGISMQEYSPDKYFEDLSNEPWVTRYADWGKETASYKGKIVALNRGTIDGWGIVLDNKLLKELNMDVPKDFDSFMALCEAIKNKGITPIYECGKDSWHQCIWLLETGDYLNKKYPGLYEKLNSPEGKFADIPEALLFTQQLKQVVDKGYFGKDFMSQTWEKRFEALESGKFAMMITTVSTQRDMVKLYPDTDFVEWEMFPVPFAGNNTFSHSGGSMGQIINKGSKYVAEAKEYFNFLAEPENLQKIYDNLTTPEAAFKNIKVNTPNLWTSLMKNCGGLTGPDYTTKIPFYNADNIGKAYQDMYIGAKTPEQVLQTIDNDRATMFNAVK